MSALDDMPVETQILIWGYALQGSDVCEKTAAIAEDTIVDAVVPDAWDRNIVWLSTQWVSHGDEPYHMPPEHWCLPAVTELRLLREQAFWELVQRA